MGSLVKFSPAKGTRLIPRPLGATPQDKFIALGMDGDVYPIFSDDGFLVVHVGSFEEGAIHAVKFKEGTLIAILSRESADFVKLQSLHPDMDSGSFPREELNVLGVVWESYPRGETGPRLIFYTKRTAHLIQSGADTDLIQAPLAVTK